MNTKQETLAGFILQRIEIQANRDALADDLAEAKIALEQTEEWQELERIKSLASMKKEAWADNDSMIRSLAIEIAQDLDDPNPLQGIKITKQKSVKVIDSKAAFDFCLKSFPGALQLNEKALEKILAAMAPEAVPDFARVQDIKFHGVRISNIDKLRELHLSDELPF